MINYTTLRMIWRSLSPRDRFMIGTGFLFGVSIALLLSAFQ